MPADTTFAALYSSFITYQAIATDLKGILREAYCSACFSTGKDELVLQFVLRNKSAFQILAKFVDGEMFFRFHAAEISFGTRSIRQLKEIESQQVTSVEVMPLERIFYLTFSNGLDVVFKGFGRFGNVLLYDRTTDKVNQIFRSNIQADWNFKLNSNAHQNLSQKQSDLASGSGGILQILPDELRQYVLSKIDLSQKDDSKQGHIVLFLEELANGNFFLNTATKPVSLSMLPGENKTSIGRGIEALDVFADKCIYEKLFLQEKQRVIARINKDLKHFRRLISDHQKQKELIATRRSYKELGDIVMTYVHSIKPGVSNAFLTDYYTGNPIRIKLDPNLSAAENAAKYYRKAKNESLELQNIETNLIQAGKKLLELETALVNAEKAVGFKDLRKDKIPVAATDVAKTLPYKEEIYQDYTIWIGKNAKSNDAMLKLAAKNDLWLHARDFAGSHVIVRKKGASFPAQVIQYAAELAARNSKGKSQTVVAVVAVERKFVSKAKNAAPGEVKLLKEQIIDAYIQ